MIKLTGEQARAICFEDTDEFETVDGGDWIGGGKTEDKDIVFKKDKKHYILGVSRSGSHFTDWSYCFEYTETYECVEVALVEVTKTEWVAV